VFSCFVFLCRSGPITAVITIPGRSGFVSGEKIHFQGEIKNQATVKINSWKVKLIQEVEYYASHLNKTHMKKRLKILDKVKSSEEIPPGEEMPISGMGVRRRVSKFQKDRIWRQAAHPLGGLPLKQPFQGWPTCRA
jgi:hypothetical protein